MVRCDTITQCPNGEDEEGCVIPDWARLVMSLSFVTILIFVFMLFLAVAIFYSPGQWQNQLHDQLIIKNHEKKHILDKVIIFIITDGVAVLLTILTMLSTPILTKIFGDGSLQVCEF